MPSTFKMLNNIMIGLMLIVLSSAIGSSLYTGIPDNELMNYLWLDYLYKSGILLLLLIPVFNLVYLSIYFMKHNEKKMIGWGLTLIIILSLGTLLLHRLK